MDRPRVLLVEDDDQIRSLLRLYLEGEGIDVTTMESGPAAIRMLTGGSHGPDVLITDLMLPGASGVEVCEAARRANARIGVLFLSGHSAAVLRTLGEVPEDAAFLRKPFALQDVAAKVRDLLVLRT